MNTHPKIAVIIVTFRQPDDIVACLRALAALPPSPYFEIFIAENGGSAAMDALLTALEAEPGLCQRGLDADLPISSRRMTRRCLFHLQSAGESRYVHVCEMTENLGYAGAINAWIEPLLKSPEWIGFWILNPDTQPTPQALVELIAHSVARKKGMVGSCMVPSAFPDRVHSRGLRWRKLMAKSLAVDFHAPRSLSPDPNEVEERLDAPSGASIYVSRDLIEAIGLMDERYFLYFEDLDWGVRAKRAGGAGYAHRSVIYHKGGTTIGTGRSPLASFLETRNRVIFVRTNFPGWVLWTIFMQAFHSTAIGLRGKPLNMIAGFRGVVAALRGETGRPDRVLYAHLHKEDAPNLKRFAKLCLSSVYYLLHKLIDRVLSAIDSAPRQRLVVLYYHSVPDDKRAAFARQMDILARRASVVSADWHGKSRTERPPVAITFDDAFKSVVDNALPELAKRGFPCTIFAPSGALGRCPDWSMEGSGDRDEVVVGADCLRQLRGPLVSIGSHSVSHPRLAHMPLERAREEILNSRVELAEILGAPVTLFAFPYGDHDAATLEVCREAGYQHAFTISPEPIDVDDQTFERGRVSVDPGDGRTEFLLKMSGAYAWMPLASVIKRRLKTLTRLSQE